MPLQHSGSRPHRRVSHFAAWPPRPVGSLFLRGAHAPRWQSCCRPRNSGSCGFTYKHYLQSQAATPISHPKQTIDVIGVENDLLGIAQAERMFQAEHRFYASLDDLLSSGAMNMKKSGRDGYTYEAAEFRPAASESSRVARATPGCTNYSIEQTIEVRPAP